MTAFQKTALATSFTLTSASGCGFVYSHWSSAGAVATGFGLAIAFVTIMASVHAIGFLLYEKQNQAETAPVFRSPTEITLPRIAGSCREAIKAAVVQQLIFLILTALLLDGGRSFRACSITAIVHWIMIAIILVCRPVHPTQIDNLLIKYGFLPLALLIGQMAPFVHRLIDR